MVQKPTMHVLEYQPVQNEVALPLQEQVHSMEVMLEPLLLLDAQVVGGGMALHSLAWCTGWGHI